MAKYNVAVYAVLIDSRKSPLGTEVKSPRRIGIWINRWGERKRKRERDGETESVRESMRERERK